MGLSAQTKVHILRIDKNGQRWYLHKFEYTRNALGELRLFPFWHSDPSWSRSRTYEMAHAIRERLTSEQGLKTYITLHAGDTAELLENL
jgi:hypothetical protein